MIDHILTSINEEIITKLGIHNYHIEEDTELIETENDKYPVARKEEKFEKISLDDAFDYVMYHRVLEEDSTLDEEKSFGTNRVYNNTINARLIVGTKIHIGKDFARDIKEAIPYKIDPAVSPTLTKGIFVEAGNINFNHDDNVTAEFGEANYGEIKDKWFVSIISYNITAFECR